MSNLPPGVTVSMLPGNTSDDAAWEKFENWALNTIVDSGLDLEESYRAIEAGIAAVKAMRPRVSELISEAHKNGICAGACDPD
jgi:hypothetical protein